MLKLNLSNQLKVALIGYGYWGSKIYTSLIKLGADVSVVDQNPLLDLPNSAVLNSLDQILLDNSITHCLIATPESTHYQLASQCLQAGKHVFVEKPLCLSSNQAKKLTKLSLKQNRYLYCDYIFLFDPAVSQLKQLMQTKMSVIQSIKSTRFTDRLSQNIAITDDLLIHDLYLLREFFGADNTKFQQSQLSSNSIAQDSARIRTVDIITDNFIFTGSYSWTASPARIIQLKNDTHQLSWIKNKKMDVIQLHQEEQLMIEKQITKSPPPLQLSVEFFIKSSLQDQVAPTSTLKQYVVDVDMLESVRE